MIKKRLVFLLLPLALALGACGEKPQTANGARLDQAAYMGTGSNFVAPGWTPVDRNSWEQHMKARTQRGQNEYNKITSTR